MLSWSYTGEIFFVQGGMIMTRKLSKSTIIVLAAALLWGIYLLIFHKPVTDMMTFLFGVPFSFFHKWFLFPMINFWFFAAVICLLKDFGAVTVNLDPPQLTEKTVVIDGMFGSGLNKPLAGGFAAMVKYINQSAAKVVSIDIPSGLMCEDNTYNIHANIIHADLTLTLQQKKLSMMLADMQQYIGRLKVLDIRLSHEFIQTADCKCSILEESDIRHMMRPRNDFAHKGSMGNALLIAGSYGMTGAAILATKACLRAGVGKVTTHTPKRNYDIM